MNVLFKMIAIAMTLISGSQAMEDTPEQSQSRGTVLDELIIWQTSLKQILDLNSDVSFKNAFGNLREICQTWQKIIDQEIGSINKENSWNKMKQDFFIQSTISAYNSIGHGEICSTFLNGQLVYTPDEGNPIILLIANLEKPFSVPFDLSTCDNTGTYLSIRTGYRKGKIAKNRYKVEIWITPWFLINEDPSKASHLAPILPNWDGTVAPIGIFYNWGDWDDLGWFEYVTADDLNSISSSNLLILYKKSAVMGMTVTSPSRGRAKNFMFISSKN